MPGYLGWKLNGRLSTGEYVQAVTEEGRLAVAVADLVTRTLRALPAGVLLNRFSITRRRARVTATAVVRFSSTPMDD